MCTDMFAELNRLKKHLLFLYKIASSRLPQGNQRSGMCLIGIARMEPDMQIIELSPILNDSPRQWITRHELDGKITYSDQR